ncbi:MAG: presqualene diphosphate synthase HpnD [Rhodospirillales bacterium]
MTGGALVARNGLGDTAADADRDHVEAAVRRSGTSFYWAMRLLPPAKRHAMFAVYAFCREVDDVADDERPLDAKRRELARWRDEIDALYRGRPGNPISRALAPCIAAFGLRREDFLAVVDGMEMDAEPQVRMRDRAELALYCDRVAGAVGRMSVRVFGVAQPQGDHLAACEGEALQLTNVLRDLKEDALRDRLYLPADMLAEAGIADHADAERVLADPGIATVCETLAGAARRRFDEATAMLAACDRRQVRPAIIMMEVYRRTLVRLMRRGWTRWAEPVALPPAEKLWVALRHGVM